MYCIEIILNVFVDIKWNQLISEKMSIVGNVFGLKNVVMKHMNRQMVNYIGLKIGKIMKKKLDLYGVLFVYYSIRDENWEKN